MRTYGTGTIEALSSGKFRAQLPGRGGKKLQTRDTREEAQRDLEIARALIAERGLRPLAQGTILGPFGRTVLLARIERNYRNAARELSRWGSRIEPSDLGRMAVESITRADVVAFVRGLSSSRTKRGGGHTTHKARTLSRSVVIDCLRILRVVVREAIDVAGLRKDDPTAGVKIDRDQGETHDPWTYLRPAEIGQLFTTAGGATQERDLGGLPRADGSRGVAVVRLVDPEDVTAARVALYMGLREGELWTLHLRDVDLAAGRVVVRYGGRGKGSKLLPTKGRRPRTLVLLEPAALALREQIERLTTPAVSPTTPRTRCKACGRWQENHAGGGCTFVPPYPPRVRPNPHGLVFPSAHPTHPGAYRAPRAPRSWAAWLRAAGLTPDQRPHEAAVVWHSLRHTFATLMLAGKLPGCEGEGWRIELVSAYLGHKSIAITQRYADVAALL